MLHHVVTFTWRDDATDAQLEAVRAGLAALPDLIPQIARYRFGPDAGLAEGNVDFAIAADFASVDDYLVYRDHPDHTALIRDIIAPLIETRTAVQFETH